MEDLKMSQVVKYGAVLGIGLSVAKMIKPLSAGLVLALVKKHLLDAYDLVMKERQGKES